MTDVSIAHGSSAPKDNMQTAMAPNSPYESQSIVPKPSPDDNSTYADEKNEDDRQKKFLAITSVISNVIDNMVAANAKKDVRVLIKIGKRIETLMVS